MNDIFSLCLVGAFVSFLGYTVENLWLGLTMGYMDNRNTVFPFLLGYGLTVVGMYYVLGTPRDFAVCGFSVAAPNQTVEIFLYSAAVMLCVSLGEIVLGTCVEKLCGIVWWDYTNLPLHFTKYTSLFTTLGFTVMIVLFMDNVFVPMKNWFAKLDVRLLIPTAVIVSVIMIVDFLHGAYFMAVKKSVYLRWRVDLSDTRLYKKLHRRDS